MNFTLRQLEIFRAVARLGSVSRAARELSMSQSAASSALGDLETQLDVELFDRVGRRLQLNEPGRVLWPRAEALLEQAAELGATFTRGGALGRLRVGATLTIGNHLGVHLVGEYLRRHPDAAVSLQVANTAEIARKVKHFEIDVGLVEGELRDEDLELTPWREDELVVFCGRGHPFATKRCISDEELLAAEWIVREPGSGTRQAFERAMHGLLPNLHLKLELQHTEAIENAVAAGMGVGCLSRVALAEALARERLVVCPVPHRDFRRNFYFLLHRQKYRSAGVKRWLELCAESSVEPPRSSVPMRRGRRHR